MRFPGFRVGVIPRPTGPVCLRLSLLMKLTELTFRRLFHADRPGFNSALPLTI